MNLKIKFVIGIGIIICSVGALVWTAVDQTKMYMITVAEYVDAKESYAGTTVRIAGRVADDSMEWDASSRELSFQLADLAADGSIEVRYSGLLPDMFAEGRDVVVEGPPGDGQVFHATAVLTSCPSKYQAEASEASEESEG
ncbi:MAG: cytochrome c-type biogenesis protein CcmE [Hyphomicrobiaceae bacterium]|jgi:cytochrome c-type biogenesis protein CcmE